MENIIVIVSVLNIMFFILHELDAFYQKEWTMFSFLKKLNPEKQYQLFLYLHIPLVLFLFYYFWTVINQNNLILWIVWNVLAIVHLIIHLVALRWKTNVFHSVHSFFFIIMTGITGLINLIFIGHY